MNSDNVIEVNHINKSFRVYQDKSHQLKDAVIFRNSKYEIRNVIKDISFSVKKGEAVGLIGKNGCGKSTTLKMLTKILKPDSGNISIKGRVSSLIELGAGFHPDMSGRENIYINASIFGIKEKEITRRMDSIIQFSELEEYIDNPVRTYSSGMYTRLAFSVAINVDADILLIDEILAVGDASFQAKCFNKLREMKEEGVTIVLVSHSLQQVEQICNRALWIDKGLIRMEGSPRKVCNEYLNEMDQQRRKRMKQEITGGNSETDTSCYELTEFCGPDAQRERTSNIYFTGIRLENENGEECCEVGVNENFSFVMNYKDEKPGRKVDFRLRIFREDWIMCYETSLTLENNKTIVTRPTGEIRCFIENALLTCKYIVDFEIVDDSGNYLDRALRLIEFRITNDCDHENGVVHMKHQWIVDGEQIEKTTFSRG